MFRLALMLALVAPSLALAQDVAPAPDGSSVTQTILWYVIQVASIAVISLAGWGAKKVGDKAGLANSAQAAELAMNVAGIATDAAEEWAASKWKLGERPTGSDKHAFAYGMVKKAVPKLAESEVDVFIQAALARKAGVGATGDDVVGAGGNLRPAGPDEAPAETDG